MDYLKGLNDKQQEAVLTDKGTVLTLAGAGSGKTRVLTVRISHLVKSGVYPQEILAVTFTNKAAKEMQERLVPYLGEATVKRMWVGTFHNICGRILRSHLKDYKSPDGRVWDNNYVIYDDTDTKTVIKNALKKLNLDEKIYEPKLIRTIISNAKNKLQNASLFSKLARDHKTNKIAEVYTEYEKQLALNNALDFDDMLMLAVKLLESNEEVRAYYANRFKHILADEFQDTNQAQYKLIRMLFSDEKAKEDGTSLFVVGDVDQSIYSWRGADFKIILNFQKDYKNTKLIKLEENYRSTGNILNAANAVIENNEERIDKVLYSNNGEGDKIPLFEAQNDTLEARYVAERTKELVEAGESLSDIAVLYRTNAQSRMVEEAFMTLGIPYKIVGGLKFYERKEIKDIIAYLKLIYNNKDSQSFRRIVNTPKRSIGDTTIKKLNEIAENNEISLFEAIDLLDEYDNFTNAVKENLRKFKELILSLSKIQNDGLLSDFCSEVLEKTGYARELREEDSIEAQSRLENLQEFINVAREFELDEFNKETSLEDTMLGTFLVQVALISDIDEALDTEKSATFMTVHSAKGLEYKTVFLIGLEEGIFPHSRSIGFMANKSELEEERRLMYVAITRAKENLYLLYSKKRMVWGDIKMYPPSRFIAEIPDKYLQKNVSNIIQTPQEGYHKSGITRVIEKRAKDTDSTFQKDPKGSLLSSIQRIKNQNNQATTVIKTPKRIEVVKKNREVASQTTTKTSEKIQTSPQKQQEKTSVSDLIRRAKEAASGANSQVTVQYLSVNTRVFHPQFGIGMVKEIIKNSTGSPIEYAVEFQRIGIKKLDCEYSNLKPF